MDDYDAHEFMNDLQRLGEDFILHFRIACARYDKEGFLALVDMVRNAPHEFPVKAQKVYQATALAFMLHSPEEMQQFNQKILKACPDDANIRRLAERYQQAFDATDREVEAIQRRAEFKVIKD